MLQKAKKYVAVAILAVTPLLTVLTPGIAHAASFTCTWTGLGGDDNFSTALNWSGCNNAAPDPINDTDDLEFPVTAPRLTPVNDLTGATFGNITFDNSSGGPYDITGNSFTVTGDITDTSDQSNVIEDDIDFSGAATISVGASQTLSLVGTISGVGTVVKAGSGQLTLGDVSMTGSLTVSTGKLAMSALSSADATVSSVTVASGATFAYDPFTNSGVTTYTLSTPITSGGTLDFQGGSASGQVLNLTGTLTLTANTNILASTGTTVHIKGSLVGPTFKVTAAGTGIVFNESTSNTSDTPSGDVMGASTTGGTSDGSTPDTPDTGFALVAAHPALTLVATLASAGAILVLARKSAIRR